MNNTSSTGALGVLEEALAQDPRLSEDDREVCAILTQQLRDDSTACPDGLLPGYPYLRPRTVMAVRHALMLVEPAGWVDLGQPVTAGAEA